MNSEALITKTALRTIDIERETLKQLQSSINEEFVACVQAIFECSGRLVVTGVGKSALIAQKIVATLNSTGSPAIFMHAADAIHGDLGMIRDSDMVLCISKSGETPEIKVLVPFLRNLGNTIIGMVSREECYLGKYAHFLLLTPVSKEADPNNLAPTASTTAQIALGDALATSLLALRGFTPNDFAQFHPGGALGKQLYLKVQDIFPHNQKPEVNEEETLRNTIIEMTSKRLGATAVLNKQQELIGIITDGDLRRMLEKAENIATLHAKDLMSVNPKTIPPTALAVKALAEMRKYSITQLIVAEGTHYFGMIHLHDLIKEGLL